MNQSPDFSEFTAHLEATISNGRAEAKAPKDSLERMRLTAIRQGRNDDAVNINMFLTDVANEIGFFRRAATIKATEDLPTLWGRFQKLFQGAPRPLTPSTFGKIEEMLSPNQPFACIEGVLIPSEKSGGDVGSSHLKGPFFAAIANNTSENVDLREGTVVCLFSQAVKNANVIELRIWNMKSFAPAFAGKKFEQATLAVPPDANNTSLSLHKGALTDLFKIAVEAIVKASLSRNPPPNVAEDYMAMVREYGGLPVASEVTEALTIAQLGQATPLSALAAPVVPESALVAVPK